MTGFGVPALWLALGASVAAGLLSGFGHARHRVTLVAWGGRCLLAALLAATVSAGILLWALITQDYSLVYVADHASRSTTWFYRLAGLWGGMAGSLLLWVWMLAGWAVVACVRVRRGWPEGAGAVQALFAAQVTVYLGLLVTVSRPLDRLVVPALDGGGLTPVLLHPAMIYHPPLLYAGAVALAVPFSIAVAAMIVGSPLPRWLPMARQFMVSSLVLLGAGMLAGAHWAYVELGWGGYWAWDPIENGALLSWLAGVAFLHSAARFWPRGADAGLAGGEGDAGSRRVTGPVGLAVGTFALSLVGAFLTRSGVTASVHAFAEARAVGRVLLGALLVTVLGVGFLARRSGPGPPALLARRSGPGPPALLARRSGPGPPALVRRSGPGPPALMGRSGPGPPALMGRSGPGSPAPPRPPAWRGRVLVVNNVILLALVVVIAFGTLLPVAVQAAGSGRVVVTGRYFALVAAPLTLALLAMIGVGSRLSGARITSPVALARLLAPTAAGPIGLVMAWVWLDEPRPITLAFSAVGAAAVTLTGAELVLFLQGKERFLQGRRRRRRTQGGGPRRRRLGMLLAHLGVAVLLIAVGGTVSGAQRTATLVPGASIRLRDYRLVLREVVSLSANSGLPVSAGRTAQATIDVFKGGQRVAVFRPQTLVSARGERVSVGALRSTPTEDLQVTLRAVAAANRSVVIEAFVAPLGMWVWWGGLMTVGGMALCWRTSGLRTSDLRTSDRRTSGLQSSASAGSPLLRRNRRSMVGGAAPVVDAPSAVPAPAAVLVEAGPEED